MKGQIFEGPRGKMLIDAQTRGVVQDICLRKVEKKGGQLYNVEFDVIQDVKDPGKANQTRHSRPGGNPATGAVTQEQPGPVGSIALEGSGL